MKNDPRPKVSSNAFTNIFLWNNSRKPWVRHGAAGLVELSPRGARAPSEGGRDGTERHTAPIGSHLAIKRAVQHRQ